MLIAHPLFANQQESLWQLFEAGDTSASQRTRAVRGGLRYLADLLRTVRWVWRFGTFDMFVAGDNLLALAGLWLRFNRKVGSVVLYSIDFVPDRFRNRALNALYHRIDKFATAHCDVVWNTSTRLIEARAARDGPLATPHLVVPIGAEVRSVRARSVAREPHSIAFLGSLLEKQGLQAVVEALPLIRQRVPDVRLVVIGDGPFRPAIEQLAADLRVLDAIEMVGFSDDHVAIEDRLLKCTVGLSPYVPDESNFTRFQDLPGKMINYLAAGLAVITTDVPRLAQKIQSAGAGRVVEYSSGAIAEAVLTYLLDPALLDRTRKAAFEFADAYEWTHIFDSAFTETGRFLTEQSSLRNREKVRL